MQLPDYAFKYGLALAVIAGGLAVVDNINPRLGTYYVLIVLLGVALTQRAGLTAFTNFIYQQTTGILPVAHHQ